MKNLAYKNILEGNWETIKGDVQNKWGKLTDNDMDKISGSYKKLIGRLQKLYGYTAAEIDEEMSEFFDKNQFAEMKKAASKKINEIKEVVLSSLDEYFSAAKQKTQHAEKALAEYVSDNPLKTIGFAAAAGMLIASCFCRNK